MIFLLQAAQQITGPEEINFGALMLRMIIFLGLTLVIIFFVLKRVLPAVMPSARYKTKNIHILERVPLDQRKSLIIAEIQERIYLLGCSDGQINILTELDREKLQAQVDPSSSKSVTFSEILKRTLSKEKSS
jgi:flagellar biosynthetic protein FliO